MTSAFLLTLILALMAPEKHRAEPELQVMDRYLTISEAVSSVSAGDLEMAAYLLTIIRFESAFWGSVHSGELGGDCDYDKKGRPKAGSCHSWCLCQINLGPRSEKRRALFTEYNREQLVGLSAEATRRCIETGAAYVSFARDRCGGNRPRCVFNSYGGVGPDADEKTRKRIAQRVETFRTLHWKLIAEKDRDNP